MSSVSLTAALLREVFPGSNVSRTEYLCWLYEQSPFGPVIEANLDDKGGRAGHYALVPIRLTYNCIERDAALSLNTAVHERARGFGVFVRLANDAIAEARRRGVKAVLGVANANSTPGFVRRLGFDLLGELPANVILPTPGSLSSMRSGWIDASAFAHDGLAASCERLLTPPRSGQARSWTTATLRWRLSQPGARYALHRSEDLMAISCADGRHGFRVAIILKVFAMRPLEPANQRALVRAACLFHRAPLALHVGLNDLVDFRGIALPKRLRESPLNLIYLGLREASDHAPVVRFEFLDFDAY